MYFPDRGCVRPLRHLCGYATAFTTLHVVLLLRVWCKYCMGQKTGLFLRVDNFLTVDGKKACDNVKIEYSLRSLRSNIQCIWNYARFDNNAWILPNFSLRQTVKITATVMSNTVSPDEIQYGHPSPW